MTARAFRSTRTSLRPKRRRSLNLVEVTGQGCSFINVGTFYGFNGVLTPPTSPVCWYEDGGRNYYSNTQFLGGGDALTAAIAGMRSLVIGGAGENLLDMCTFGLDTVVRATNANATIELIWGYPAQHHPQGHLPSRCQRRQLTFTSRSGWLAWTATCASTTPCSSTSAPR